MLYRRGYPGRGGRARRRPSRRPAVAGLASSVLAACLFAFGCGREGAAEGRIEVVTVPEIRALPPQKLVLTGSAASLEELLRTVELALAERDTARLLDLMVSEREYRDIVYPTLPAAHPPINASFESLWVTHFPDAHRGLRRILDLYGGRNVRILDVRFERPDQDFVNFTLHETSRVDLVVDRIREEDIRLFGSVIRVGAEWKVLSYPDDR